MTGALADTHALLWWLADDPRLSDRARRLISVGETPVHFSAASIWEAEIKAAMGELTLPGDLLWPTASSSCLSAPGTGARPRGYRCALATRSIA